MELDGLASDPTLLGKAAKATIALVVDHVGSHADVLKVQMLHGDSLLTMRSSQINFNDPVSWEHNILCYPDTSLHSSIASATPFFVSVHTPSFATSASASCPFMFPCLATHLATLYLTPCLNHFCVPSRSTCLFPYVTLLHYTPLPTYLGSDIASGLLCIY